MSIITDFLNLFKYDPETDGASTFNIKQCLNDNWDKIDAWASGIKSTLIGKASLGENGTVPVTQGGTGETTPQAALAALGAGVRHNLLDNAYFVGGGTGWGVFPVNQKGVLSGNVDRQFICDRWNQFGSDWSLTQNGLVMAKRTDADYWAIFQNIPANILSSLVGKIVTMSVLFDGSFVTSTQTLSSPTTSFPFLNGERIDVYIDSGVVQYYGGSITRTFKAIKFETGDSQTLAYQDSDGNWNLLPQPESDYATQLLKCQKYLFDCENGNASYPAMINGTSGIATIQTPVQMAKTPVLVKKSSGYGVIYVNGSSIAVTNATVDICAGNFVTISFQIAQSVVSNCVWRECTFWLDTGM